MADEATARKATKGGNECRKFFNLNSIEFLPFLCHTLGKLVKWEGGGEVLSTNTKVLVFSESPSFYHPPAWLLSVLGKGLRAYTEEVKVEE